MDRSLAQRWKTDSQSNSRKKQETHTPYDYGDDEDNAAYQPADRERERAEKETAWQYLHRNGYVGQAWQEFSVASHHQRQANTLKHYALAPAIRDLDWRKEPTYLPGRPKDRTIKRNQGEQPKQVAVRLRPLLVQLTGEITPDPCSLCAEGKGKFVACVPSQRKPGTLGVCANHLFDGTTKRCRHNEGNEGVSPPKKQKKAPGMEIPEAQSPKTYSPKAESPNTVPVERKRGIIMLQPPPSWATTRREREAAEESKRDYMEGERRSRRQERGKAIPGYSVRETIGKTSTAGKKVPDTYQGDSEEDGYSVRETISRKSTAGKRLPDTYQGDSEEDDGSEPRAKKQKLGEETSEEEEDAEAEQEEENDTSQEEDDEEDSDEDDYEDSEED